MYADCIKVGCYQLNWNTIRKTNIHIIDYGCTHMTPICTQVKSHIYVNSVFVRHHIGTIQNTLGLAICSIQVLIQYVF